MDIRTYLIDLFTLAGYPLDPASFADVLIARGRYQACVRLMDSLAGEQRAVLDTQLSRCRTDEEVDRLLASAFPVNRFGQEFDRQIVSAIARWLEDVAPRLSPAHQQEVLAYFVRRGQPTARKEAESPATE